MKWRFNSDGLTEPDSRYRAKVDHWVSLAAGSGIEAWEPFLKSLPGVSPLDAWASLNRLGIPIDILSTAASTTSSATVAEHPFDFEWRFSASATSYVIGQIRVLIATASPSIACYGCPSIFSRGVLDEASWRWHLIDQRLITGDFGSSEILRHDLRKPLKPSNSVDVAVLDPPWYNKITQNFLSNAKSILKPGGHVLLSMPSVGTRASAEADQIEIVEWAQKIGFEQVAIHRGTLAYKSPFFETNAFRAAGFSTVLHEWRNGDLFVFRDAMVGSYFPHWDAPNEHEGYSEEFEFGALKIVTTGIANSQNDIPGLRAVWAEDVLPSVSARFPGRVEANVITSGNRFFYCSDLTSLRESLRRLSSGNESPEGSNSGSLDKRILEILQFEMAEFELYMSND